MRLFDSHAHVHFKAYEDDAREVIERALADEVWMVTVGTQRDTSKTAIETAEKFEKGVYASIGLHPTHTIAHGFNDTQELDFKPRAEAFDPAYYQSLKDASSKVVAVGECGLDYYRLPEGDAKTMKQTQYAAFMAQAEFARKNTLPLIIHCREAHDDQFAAIQEAAQQWGEGKRGVIHCFTGTYEEAKKYIDIGWYISFSGIAVFADAVGQVAAKLPLEQMLVETDAPYLTPPPFRGKRNEPAHVKYIVQDIARRKGLSEEHVAEQTFQNALAFFGIKDDAR